MLHLKGLKITSHSIMIVFPKHVCIVSCTLLIYDTLINEKKHHEMLINYFILDDLGGYQKEKKTSHIDNCDIVKPLKQPFKKYISLSRSTFVFNDL